MHMFNKFDSLCTIVFVFVVDLGLVHCHNWVGDEDRHTTDSQARGKGQARRVAVKQYVGCTPIKTYPSNLPEDIPWENDVQQLTLRFLHLTIKGSKVILLVWISLLRVSKVWRLLCIHFKNSSRHIKVLNQL